MISFIQYPSICFSFFFWNLWHVRIVLLKVGGNGEPGSFFMSVVGTFEGFGTQVIFRVYPGF